MYFIYYDISMRNFLLLFLLISTPIISQESEVVEDTSIDTQLTNEDSGFLDDYYIGTDSQAPVPLQTESAGMTLLRIALITGILAFLTWVVIRFFFKRNALSISTEGTSIEILATVPAGLGSYFVIAKLHTLYYLCSLSADGLRMLDKISDQEAIDFIELNKAQTLPQDMQFIDLIENLPDGKPKQALEFLREKINYLKKK